MRGQREQYMQAVITYAKQQYISPPHKYISPSQTNTFRRHTQIFIHPDSSVCFNDNNATEIEFPIQGQNTNKYIHYSSIALVSA